jgi:hypothetical protein
MMEKVVTKNNVFNNLEIFSMWMKVVYKQITNLPL